MSNFEHNASRLAWACRRGMLELDLILQPFLERRYSTLSDTQKQAFQSLLNYPDPELLSWLMGYEEAPSDPDLSDIIAQIRQYAHSPART